MRLNQIQVGDWYTMMPDGLKGKIDHIIGFEVEWTDYNNIVRQTFVKDLRPIQLTAEIVSQVADKVYENYNTYVVADVELVQDEDSFVIVDQEHSIGCIYLMYVHELQHFLRLMGADLLADKIHIDNV